MLNLWKSIEKRIKIPSLPSPEISTQHFCECPSYAFCFIVSLILHVQFNSLVVVWGAPPTSFISVEIIPKVSFNELIRVNHMTGNLSLESADSHLIAAHQVFTRTYLQLLYQQSDAGGGMKQASYRAVAKRNEVSIYVEPLAQCLGQSKELNGSYRNYH